MSTIKVSLDKEMFWSKPNQQETAIISMRIAEKARTLELQKMNEFVESITLDGHIFCPATFKGGKRSKDNFEQQQMFALDFDNKDPDRTVSFEDVKDRAEKYNLPILFAYDTFSSTEHDKFRVVFLNDTSIPDRKVAEAMQLALGTIFPEADSSCYRDVSKMYFGGKERRYYDKSIPTINVESVFRGATYWKKDTSGKHLKEWLRKFSQDTGIALNEHGFLDIQVIDDPTEFAGATQSIHNGDISPNAIIYSPNIIVNGEKSPNKYYRIKLVGCTKESSVVTSVTKTDVTQREYKNHNDYRRSDLERMSQVCRLFREFESGSRDMRHQEIFGILNNLINVDSGITRFKDILLKYPELYDSDRRASWDRHSSYNKLNGYKPTSCNNFCPYCNECNHGKNILTTVRLRHGVMEPVPGYREEFVSLEEAQNDVYKAIDQAVLAQDNRIYVIKGQVGIGKSYSYLRIEQEHPEWRFLFSGPTNLLKDELFDKAVDMGKEVRKTPSLEQIKYVIPHKVWKRIQKFYKRGQHKKVHQYIQNYINKILLMSDSKEKKKKLEDIDYLLEYMIEREALKSYHGDLFTTHRYMLNMDEDRLQEFDVIIIDEDILFKAVITNQEEIPISQLKELLKKTTDRCLIRKTKSLLKKAEDRCCIELDSFEWDDNDDADDDLCNFDLPAFCQAEKFYVRRASKERNLKEDTVVFLKPVSFSENKKYIIVSATADETIYRQYFGEDRVDFYECKKARNMGPLHQYPGKSMSRSSIANDPGIVQWLMKRFHMSEDHVITFMREEIGELHFGNTEGSNRLEGEDILVVGTPYHADFIYKLAAFTMGLDFDEDEEPELQTVTHNGYRFRFTTFKNENLRAIQFWMIESELEQAVGRARLLRNSCEVHLFSNFPLDQAEMVEDFDYGKGEESLSTRPEQSEN